jgi:hypothetical protein
MFCYRFFSIQRRCSALESDQIYMVAINFCDSLYAAIFAVLFFNCLFVCYILQVVEHVYSPSFSFIALSPEHVASY